MGKENVKSIVGRLFHGGGFHRFRCGKAGICSDRILGIARSPPQHIEAVRDPSWLTNRRAPPLWSKGVHQACKAGCTLLRNWRFRRKKASLLAIS
jgi:hypothetical protein